MRIGALCLFKRQHCNGKPSNSWIIASWHWKWSLTWRWVITYTKKHSGNVGFYFRRVYKYSKGLNFHCGFNLPIIGSVNIQTQPNMKI